MRVADPRQMAGNEPVFALSEAFAGFLFQSILVGGVTTS